MAAISDWYWLWNLKWVRVALYDPEFLGNLKRWIFISISQKCEVSYMCAAHKNAAHMHSSYAYPAFVRHVCIIMLHLEICLYAQNKCRMRANSNMQYMRDMYANCIHAALQFAYIMLVCGCMRTLHPYAYITPLCMHATCEQLLHVHLCCYQPLMIAVSG